MKRTTFVELIAYFFIILFLYTGFSKLMDFYVFKEQLATSPLLASVSGVVAIGLPAIEIIVSIILFLPKTRLRGLYASLALMSLFTGYVIYIINFNDQLPCTCGGILQELSWEEHLIVNIAFVALAITGIILSKKSTAASGQKRTMIAHG